MWIKSEFKNFKEKIFLIFRFFSFSWEYTFSTKVCYKKTEEINDLTRYSQILGSSLVWEKFNKGCKMQQKWADEFKTDSKKEKKLEKTRKGIANKWLGEKCLLLFIN